MPAKKKTTEVNIVRVRPDVILIGASAFDAVVEGTSLDDPAGMEAAVCEAGSTTSPDSAILVEQPLPSHVTATRFPITITAPAGTPEGSRAVMMQQSGKYVDHLDNAIELKHKK